jgi:hypothetical protein
VEEGDDVRVTNEPDEGGGGAGAFGELLRLQTEFQTRLAEETLRYLRRLQGTLGPTAPGTIVVAAEGQALHGAAPAGARATLRLEVENLQRVHCMLTPQLTPLVGRTGTTWFPALEPAAPSLLLAPGAVRAIELTVPLPAELPADLYAGALVLQGFRNGALPVVIEVADGGRAAHGPARGARAKEAGRKGTATRTSATKATATKTSVPGKARTKKASSAHAASKRVATKKTGPKATGPKKNGPKKDAGEGGAPRRRGRPR